MPECAPDYEKETVDYHMNYVTDFALLRNNLFVG